MAGSSQQEIDRQHAEALELLKVLPPLALSATTEAPISIGPAIPLTHKTKPIAECTVVQDMSTVTGVDYVNSLLFKSNVSSSLSPSPQSTRSSDSDTTPDDENQPQERRIGGTTKSNGQEEDTPQGGGGGTPSSTDTDISDITTSSKDNLLLPVEALAPYWSLRGQVDVTALQHLVAHGYNQPPSPLSPSKRYQAKDISDPKNYWDTVHAAVRNVSIQRPSHDQWGIPKIVLVFCDDFVQRVFELPWWTQDNSPFRTAIQPILDTLGIRRDHIVRLLLASLPPGTTIPIHSDSGEWVKSTHRVHVPVLVHNADKILFRCGPRLERIPTPPGYIFEINNQSWHAVSNCDSDYRVHLILDYLDDDDDDDDNNNNSHNSTVVPRQRLTLSAGEILRQTRRSVDRAMDVGKRPTPSFLILGAQKAGTTSLFEALMQHPWIVKPVQFRETHCLDWRWNGNLTKVEDQRKHVASFFETATLKHYPSCLTGDSTPSYLIDARRVIPRLQKVWPHWKTMKFFVMLREPIQRCESHYAMVTSAKGTPAQLKARGSEWRNSTLEDVIEQDLNLLNECGVIPYWSRENGVDRDAFDKFINTGAEYQGWQRYMSHIPTSTGSYALIGRSLYALNLLPWLRCMDRKQFFVINLDHWSTEPQSILPHVWRHLDVPHCGTVSTEAQNTRSYDSKLSPEWKNRLEAFFEPHNERLVTVLDSRHNPWKPCWYYSKEHPKAC